MMINLRRNLCGSAVVAVALGISLVPMTARAETFRLRIGAGHPAVLPYTVLAKDYFVPEVQRRVEEETDHRVRFTEAYGGSVAKLPEVLDATSNGLLDFGLLSTPFEPRNLFMQNYAYYVPFGVSDPARAGEIARQLYDEFPAFSTTLEEQNQLPLAVFASSNYNIITKDPVNSPSDLSGVKLMAAGANAAWLQGTGAVPVQSGLNEAYNSLQTGVYSGVLMHYQGMDGFKIYEPAQYITVTNFGSLPINMLTVNTETWESLPEEVRDIVSEVARELESKVNALTAERDKLALERMSELGVTVTHIADEDLQNWAESLRELPKTAAEEGAGYGIPMGELLERYIEILKEDGNAIVDSYVVK